MQFYNTLNGAYPLALHFPSAPGKYTVNHSDIVQKIIRSGHVTIPSNCTVLTYATPNVIEDAVLIKQLNYHNIKYINLCSTSKYGKWDNTQKLSLLNNYLQNGNVTTQYVAVFDSMDIVLSESFEKLVDEFLKFDVDILYGSTSARYPEYLITDYESEDRNPYRYLNSGTLVARTEHLTKFIYHCYINQHRKYNKFKSDQYIIRKNLNNGNRKKFNVDYDYESKLFLTTNFFYENYYSFKYETLTSKGKKIMKLLIPDTHENSFI